MRSRTRYVDGCRPCILPAYSDRRLTHSGSLWCLYRRPLEGRRRDRAGTRSDYLLVAPRGAELPCGPDILLVAGTAISATEQGVGAPVIGRTWSG